MAMWIVTLLVLVSMVNHGLGCTCEMLHPQKYFCDSDYVIRGKVMKVDMTMNIDGMPDFAYNINVKKIFKAPKDNPLDIEVQKDLLAVSDGMCAYNLMENGNYMVQGNIVNGRFEFDMCRNRADEWEQMTVKERDQIEKDFDQHCQCKIFGDNKDEMPTMGRFDFCEMGNDYHRKICLIQNSLCMRMENDRCMWSSGMYCTQN